MLHSFKSVIVVRKNIENLNTLGCLELRLGIVDLCLDVIPVII